jgi:hypothetical protein
MLLHRHSSELSSLKMSMEKDDSEKSTEELVDEYTRIMDLTDRADNAVRVREIMAELEKRSVAPGPKRHGS